MEKTALARVTERRVPASKIRQQSDPYRTTLDELHVGSRVWAQKTGLLRQLEVTREDILLCTIKQDKARRDCTKMSFAVKVFGKAFNNIQAKPVAQIVRESAENLSNAELAAERAAADAAAHEGESHEPQSQADKVRLKNPQLRSKDERLFIGMDVVMRPEAYAHLSIIEAEEMQFDPDYQCELSKSELDRLANLPEQVTLCFPFLHSSAHMEAHRVLNKVLKGYDEEFFINRDYLSDHYLPPLGVSDNIERDKQVVLH